MAISAYFNSKATLGTAPDNLAELGAEHSTKGGAVWKLVKASGAITQYDICHITAANLAISSTTALVGTAARPTVLGVAQIAVADTEYFWIPIGPFTLREDGVTAFKVNAAVSCATSVKLCTTINAGVVDDAPSTGVIQGLALSETITTARAATCVAASRLTSFCDT
jgi:hypothetical protein